jgi:hypothetical protein
MLWENKNKKSEKSKGQLKPKTEIKTPAEEKPK